MKLIPITIEEILVLGIKRFYILEEEHFTSAKIEGNNSYLWDSINQKWDGWYTNHRPSIKALTEHINYNKYPVYIKLNKETNDTNSK